jgi:hypothetical protein
VEGAQVGASTDNLTILRCGVAGARSTLGDWAEPADELASSAATGHEGHVH